MTEQEQTRGTDQLERLMTSSIKRYNRNVICEICSTHFESTIYVRGNGSETKPDSLCPVCRKEKEEQEWTEQERRHQEEVKEKRLDLWYEQYGVTGIFIEKTLKDFKRELQPKAFDAVKNWKDTSLVLYSPGTYGVGKTHLVSALASELVENTTNQRMCPVHFTTEQKLLNRIRQTYNRRDEEGEMEEDVFSALERFHLLIIDDVGKVRPRDYSFLQGVYFRIIDDRYTEEDNIILTTNLDLAELETHIGGASSDRLREMAGKQGFIKMTGKSERR